MRLAPHHFSKHAIKSKKTKKKYDLNSSAFFKTNFNLKSIAEASHSL